MELNYRLLARYLADECTDREKERLEGWIQKNPDNKRKLKEFERIWSASEKGKKMIKQWFDAEQDWEALKRQIHRQKESQAMPVENSASRLYPLTSAAHSRVQQLMRFAAIFIIAALTGIISYQNWYPDETIQKDPVLREIMTENGQRINLTLSDGSYIQLNAASKIKLPATFQPDIREVFVQGEAYFDIAKDPSKPFVIHSSGAVIRVLGTSLSVRAYPEDEEVRVVVKEGRVSLESADKVTSQKAILTEGQLGRYNLKSKEIESEKLDDPGLYLSWLEGHLKFNKASMNEVAVELERRYDITVTFEDRDIKDLKLTAYLKSRSIRNVLDVVTKSLDINYSLEENRVRFFKENNPKADG